MDTPESDMSDHDTNVQTTIAFVNRIETPKDQPNDLKTSTPGDIRWHNDNPSEAEYKHTVFWTQEQENAWRIWNEQNGTQYHNPHQEGHKTPYHEARFLARVMRAPPDCGCRWEMIYAFTDGSLGYYMQHLAETRDFANWGCLRWRTSDNMLEEIPLGDCEMIPMIDTPNPRAVVWGCHLSLLVFGITPLNSGINQ